MIAALGAALWATPSSAQQACRVQKLSNGKSLTINPAMIDEPATIAGRPLASLAVGKLSVRVLKTDERVYGVRGIVVWALPAAQSKRPPEGCSVLGLNQGLRCHRVYPAAGYVVTVDYDPSWFNPNEKADAVISYVNARVFSCPQSP